MSAPEPKRCAPFVPPRKVPFAAQASQKSDAKTCPKVKNSIWLIIGVSWSRDISGLSFDFERHLPPGVSSLSFNLKAEA
jgi:hypothetical protein